MPLATHIPTEDAPPPPTIVSVAVEGDQVALCWEPADTADAGAGAYQVYRAAPPTYAHTAVDGPTTALCFSEVYTQSQRSYVVTAIDGLGRESAFSAPVWAPRRPPSARVLDSTGTIVLEFGQRGTAPGQFETPAGVAAIGYPPAVGGPYAVDAHTVLLLAFDDTFEPAGGTGARLTQAQGVALGNGRYERGVTVNAGDSLRYTVAEPLDPQQGAVEFWVRPAWNGADGRAHTLVELGGRWFNRLRIQKTASDRLQIELWSATGSSTALGDSVAHWQAGEWHHIGATWEAGTVTLYIDGRQRAHRRRPRRPHARRLLLPVRARAH